MLPPRLAASAAAVLLLAAACGSSPAVSPTPTPTPAPPVPMVLAGSSSAPGGGGLYAVNGDGSGFRHVPGTVPGDRAPSLSPDGRRIAFAGTEGAAEGLFLINAAGTGRTALTVGGSAADDDVPMWSPDGRAVLFLRDNAPGYMVMTVDPSSGRTTQVGTVADGTDELVHPSWSPDGRFIVFEDTAGSDGARDLYALAVTGGRAARLGAPGRPVQDYQPAWSPDGGRIAFVEESGTDRAVMVMNGDGTGRVRISGPAPATDTAPAWSPDGGELAFETPGRTGGSIAVVAAGGGAARTLPLAGALHTPGWATGPAHGGVHLPPIPTPVPGTGPPATP